MKTKLFRGTTVGVLAALGIGEQSTHAAIITGPTTLDQLLIGSGNQYLVGDKLFFDFTYQAVGGAQPEDPAMVSINAVNGPFNQGILISGAFSSASEFGDIALSYKVQVDENIAPDLAIVDAELVVLGVSSGEITIVEDLRSLNGEMIGSMMVNSSSPEMQLDRIVFEPVKGLQAYKDIELIAEEGIIDSFSITTQLFSQSLVSIPESSSVLALLSLGALKIIQKISHVLKN